MPRVSRENSKAITKTYHILLRGINKQDIFLDNQDKSKFLKELKETKQEYECKLYAYVIMSNHVHLVIYDPKDKISEIIHKIGTKYGMYFNSKYGRIGHVFQNRFKSICVDTEEYLKNLIRYVHQNPEKDGICPMMDYHWSSYREYIYKENVTDTEFVLSLFHPNKERAIKLYIEFCQGINHEYSDAEFEIENKLTDEEALDCIKRMLNIEVNDVLACNIQERNRYIYWMSQIKGIRVRQISRFLGIGTSYLYKVIKNEGENKKEGF